ncbi:zinc finger protein 415-like isoform X2 [Ornithodoros turicata]|uniref:zinc finger protein 415-like isoform X2 n=1 Tax=Ornithodoros turicata TaxID=34597 RepID=UPI00313A13D0
MWTSDDNYQSEAIRGIQEAAMSAKAESQETDARSGNHGRHMEEVDSETLSTDYGDDSLQGGIGDESSCSDLELTHDDGGETNGKLHALLSKDPYEAADDLAAYGDSNITVELSSEGSSADRITASQWKEGVKCPHCSYVGYGATRLEQHVARAHAKDITYKCGLCGFTCKWNREYYTHMKNHLGGSGGVPPYRCDVCSYKCDRIQLVLLHRMKHTDEKPYSCGTCDYRCRQRTNLVAHMRSHTGERPFRCEHCGRAFALKCTLEQHLQSHREDRPYLCDVCGFTAKYQSHLISHRRLHTGNVYRCQFAGCTYVSPKKSQLEAHTRTHTAVRSHVCAVCGRAFIERSHLVRHERIHLDDKPFKCPECDYSSTRRDKLKEHQQKHHGENATAKGPYRPRRAPRSTPVSLQRPYEEVVDSSALQAPGNQQRYLVVPAEATGMSLSHLQQPVDLQDDGNIVYVEAEHLVGSHMISSPADLGVEDGMQQSLSAAVVSNQNSVVPTAADLNGLNSFMAFF